MARSHDERSSTTYRERNATSDRALDILQLFNAGKLVWTANEIAEQLGVSRSTGYRYLQSLLGSGFIEESEGGFRLGPRVQQLAQVARSGIGLSRIAAAVMHELVARTGETVLLTCRSGAAVVCLEAVESPHPIRLSYERGQVLPINAGAAAQVLLAWSDPAETSSVLSAHPLTRFTSRTLTSVEELQIRFGEIRERGIAVARGELDPDVVGVAAPIRNRSGDVLGAVSVAAYAARVTDTELPAIEQAVREAAAKISAGLDPDTY